MRHLNTSAVSMFPRRAVGKGHWWHRLARSTLNAPGPFQASSAVPSRPRERGHSVAEVASVRDRVPLAVGREPPEDGHVCGTHLSPRFSRCGHGEKELRGDQFSALQTKDSKSHGGTSFGLTRTVRTTAVAGNTSQVGVARSCLRQKRPVMHVQPGPPGCHRAVAARPPQSSSRAGACGAQ